MFYSFITTDYILREPKLVSYLNDEILKSCYTVFSKLQISLNTYIRVLLLIESKNTLLLSTILIYLPNLYTKS